MSLSYLISAKRVINIGYWSHIWDSTRIIYRAKRQSNDSRGRFTGVRTSDSMSYCCRSDEWNRNVSKPSD